MDKSTLAKRKAQKLARDGHLQQAVEEMRRVLAEAESDPYDYVYVGDLHARLGQDEEALEAWQSAVHAYEGVGLYRNAIAICKKILRLARSRAEIHRILGDLYIQESLTGEAIPHYLTYLDSFGGPAEASREFQDALDRLASLPGLPVEATLRLAAHFDRAGLSDRAARLLDELADTVAAQGSLELAGEIRERARHAEAAYLASRTVEGGNQSVAASSRSDRSSVRKPDPGARDADLEQDPDPRPDSDPSRLFDLSWEDASEAEAPGVGPPPVDSELFEPTSAGRGLESASPTGGRSDSDATRREFPASPPEECDPEIQEGDGEPNSLRMSQFDLEPQRLPRPFDPAQGSAEGDLASIPDLRVIRFPGPADDPQEESGPLSGDSDTAAEGMDAGDASAPAAMEKLEEPEARAGDHLLLQAAAERFKAGDWPEARGLYERLQHARPMDRTLLDLLIQICRRCDDLPGEIRYRVLMGDAWIEEGDLDEALQAFRDLLRLDPENATARRRLSRFRDMGVAGADLSDEEQHPILEVLETGGATVAVAQDNPAIKDDEWVDLGALLDEFKEGIKNEIDGSDFQSHYDLAISHRAMGLLDEAVEETDLVLGQPDLPGEWEARARQLKGECLVELERHREAIHEFREAAEKCEKEGCGSSNARYHLGVALELAGEWREAGDVFEQILREFPDYLDVKARLEGCRSRESGPDPTARAA